MVTLQVRNEKLVSCIAAGKWVLCPQWLDASARAGRLVDEEPYEWGNPVRSILQSSEKACDDGGVFDRRRR